MAADELKQELISLIKKVPAAADSKRYQKPLAEIQPTLTPDEEQEEDLTKEYEYVKTYRDLVDIIDTLMSQENTRSDEKYSEMAEKLKLVHDFTGEGDVESDENKLEYLKQMQQVRKLVIESGVSTLPTLRAIHHVDRLSTKEKAIAHKVNKRDELSLEIIKVQKSVDDKRLKLTELTKQNESLISQAQDLTQKLMLKSMTKRSVMDEETIAKLKAEHQKYFKRSQSYAEEIEAIMVEQGINWAADEESLRMIELCGSLYETAYD